MNEFCVDYEIAKELKANGFPQNTKFYWHNIHGYSELEDFKANDYTDMSNCSAPFSDEILKQLPNQINGYILQIERYEDGTIEADYTSYYHDKTFLVQSRKLFYKLSDCLANLYIDLKKEGYIK